MLGLGMCGAAFGCGGGAKPALEPGSLTGDQSAGSTVNESDAGPRDAAPAVVADAGADAGADAEPSAPPIVDPAVAHALVAKSGEGSGAAPLGLRFEVMELGAELPWAFALVNRGTEAAVVDFGRGSSRSRFSCRRPSPKRQAPRTNSPKPRSRQSRCCVGYRPT